MRHYEGQTQKHLLMDTPSLMKPIRYLALAGGISLAGVACQSDDNVLGDSDLAYLIDAEADEVVDALVVTTTAEAREAEEEFEEAGDAHSFSGDCFTLIYPVEISYPDGSVTTAESTEEVRAQVREYLLADRRNRRRARRPTLVYPVTVQLADGTLSEFGSRLDFFAQVRECRPDFEVCASLSFPAEVTVGGALETFETAEELRAALLAYRRANPRGSRSELVWPQDFITLEGDTITFDSRQAYRSFVTQCRSERFDCIGFAYPLTVVNRDGVERAVNDRAQLRRARSHAGPGGRHRLVFPLTAVVDGEEVEVDSWEALREARVACRQ